MPQHQTDASRHQGVAPEIKIQLQRISHRTQPCQRRGNTLKTDLGDLVPEDPKSVRDQDLHAKSDRKKAHPVLHLLQCDDSGDKHCPSPDIGRLLDPALRKPHDRALCDLGKHREIGCSLGKGRSPAHIAPVQVRLIGDHLENIEAQSKRKKRCPHLQRQDLKEDQDQDIDHHDDDQHLPLLCLSAPAGRHPYHLAHQVVDKHQSQKQQDKPFGSGGIENQTPHKKQGILVCGWNNPVYDHENGQKAKNKFEPRKINHMMLQTEVCPP